jgi:5-methylcytosine-specific restriction endonuclease McrA
VAKKSMIEKAKRTPKYRVQQHNRCRLCGRSPATLPGLQLHIDHIVAWSKGGETVDENLQTLCSDCNYGKCDHM